MPEPGNPFGVETPPSTPFEPEDLTELSQREAALDSLLREGYARLRPLREARDELRREIAERSGKAELPRARFRTPTQEKVARCPRCMREIV